MHAKSLELCPTLCDCMDYKPPGSSVRGILQARILKWVVMPSSRGSSQAKDWIQVSCIQMVKNPPAATKETQEYWSGSLSLLQELFLTEELNWGFLHCRWILYQLSYQGSPIVQIAYQIFNFTDIASYISKVKQKKGEEST